MTGTAIARRPISLRERLAQSRVFGIVRRLVANPKAAIGIALLLMFIAMAVFRNQVAPYDPIELHLESQLAAPSAKYWFGTDELGRDILSRVIHGAPIALETGVIAVSLAGLVGVLSGVMAGYLGGWYDSVIMRIWDALLAFPAIFLAIGIVTLLGPGYMNAVLAVAIINMPTFARLTRATTLALREKEFVEAARCIGCSSWRIMLRGILPNCIAPIMVQIAIAVPHAVTVEASLSFLGLGSQPPDPSWGNMLAAAQGYLYRSPTYGIFPGLAITVLVIALNFFADGLQDAIDPRRMHAAAKMQ